MVYPQPHMLLQWGGTVRSGDQPTSPMLEIFSGTMRFGGPGVAEADNKNTAIALGIVMSRYWNDAAAMIPTRHWLEYVKWNRISPAGTYASDVNSNTVAVEPVAGGRPFCYPLQVTWVTTWGTDAVRGKATRGRTFWPTTAPMQGDFKVNPGDAVVKVARDNRLIRELNAAARSAYVSPGANQPYPSWAVDAGFAPGATQEGSGLSAMVMSKIGDGTARVITHAEVGTRLDVQRRRANNQLDVRVQE